MIRLLIIAHAPLASALQAVGTHIDPEAAAMIGVCDVGSEQTIEEVVAACKHVLENFGDSETLILTDVYGATPCNAARQVGERPHTRVVAGVSVPVLWRALGHINEPLDIVAELAVAGGKQGVMHVTDTRPQYQSLNPVTHDSPHDHHQQ